MPFSHPSPAAAVRGRLARAPRRRAVAGLAAAGLAALLLGGCTSAPAQPPSPTPTASAAEPIFASDEEALAAAVAAYERFEVVSGDIAADGGDNSGRIEEVATERYSPQLREEFDQYRVNGLRIEGSSTVDSFRLAEHSQSAGSAEVSIYLCRDVSGVRVLDSAGADVTPEGRDARTPLTVVLVSASVDGELLVDEIELWPGEDFC